jgi:hypothetical protein
MKQSRFVFALALCAMVLLFASPSHATLNACSAGKKKCVSKKVASIMKCHIKAETPPGLALADFTACIQKAKDKFDGGAKPMSACFTRLEAKFPGGCITTDDMAALEAKVDAFIDDVVCELDPAAGTCPCPAGEVLCGNVCADVASDPANCGACGIVCPAGDVCTSGQCTCPLGQTLCGGVCVFTAIDLNNCGTCGNVCTVQNGSPSCIGGTCGVGGCFGSFRDCDNNVVDGCETDISSNTSNCGACGSFCFVQNGFPVCGGGTCQVGGCNNGFANCDNNPGDGCEVNLSNNSANCGTCGHFCSLPNATSVCSGGVCFPTSCNSGFADCDNNPFDGCEVDLSNNNANCGQCGHFCSLPNASSFCGNSFCQLGSCNPGFASCNGNPFDGCETNLNSDDFNCGFCGIQCNTGFPNFDHCNGGVCS